MRRTFGIVLAILGLVVNSVVVNADETSDAKKAIQAQYNAHITAHHKKDAKALLAGYSKDYIGVSAGGTKRTYAQLEKEMGIVFTYLKTFKGTISIQKLTLKGNQATVVTKEHAEFSISNPQTQKTVELIVDETNEDVWAKSGKIWLKKASKNLTNKTKMDGKEVDVKAISMKKAKN